MMMSFLELTSHSVCGATRNNRALDMHLALDITFFLLPVGSIFDELEEMDSDLDDDLDRLDPDTDHQELRQPVEWLQQSCTSGAKYNADVRSTEREGKIEYPTVSN